MSHRLPDDVQPSDSRICRWVWRRVNQCVRAKLPSDAEAALIPIWERVERSSRFADSAFVAIQRMRDLGTLYDDEGTCLLNEIYEYRAEYYEKHDDEYRRLVDEEAENVFANREVPNGISSAIQRRSRELAATYLRARGELALADRVLADDEALAGELYDGEASLVLDKQPYPRIEPADGQWVALLRERITAMITAETLRETFELRDRLHDVLREAEPASAVEAVRQLREVGVVTRAQMFHLADSAISEVVLDAVAADRRAARLDRDRERLGLSTAEESDVVSAARAAIERAFEVRWNQLQASYLRRFGMHEMAEVLRRDPAEYQEIVDSAPFSDCMGG